VRQRQSTFGGGRDQAAVIGHPPEHRDWTPEDPTFAPEIGPEVRIEAHVSIDAGFDRPTRIGARSWLLKKCHVGHDAIFGEDVLLSTGCIIGGYAEIGDRAKIDLGAIVLPHRRVGEGAVVTKDVPAGETWAGNPARPMQRNPVPFSDRR
jgi:acyl-[acyl carrier protein]--UDP-N-acetylglucosamine O-acyltransferase